MERLKLPNVGDFAIIHVTRCAVATVGKFPGIEFEGTTPHGEHVLLEVPTSSAMRQLERLGLTTSTAVGQPLSFSRDPNPAAPSKPYWGIGFASGVSHAPAKAPARPVAPADEPPPPNDSDAPTEAIRVPTAPGLRTFDLHRSCFIQALDLADLAKQRGYALDGAAISALTAQTFIAATR